MRNMIFQWCNACLNAFNAYNVHTDRVQATNDFEIVELNPVWNILMLFFFVLLLSNRFSIFFFCIFFTLLSAFLNSIFDTGVSLRIFFPWIFHTTLKNELAKKRAKERIIYDLIGLWQLWRHHTCNKNWFQYIFSLTLVHSRRVIIRCML